MLRASSGLESEIAVGKGHKLTSEMVYRVLISTTERLHEHDEHTQNKGQKSTRYTDRGRTDQRTSRPSQRTRNRTEWNTQTQKQ